MKRQKIAIDIRQAMAETTSGSTARADAIDIVEDRYNLSSGQMRTALLHGFFVDHWNR